jgi:phospholipid/cholesterol/gamma-HCH transport system substrate-binding protein
MRALRGVGAPLTKFLIFALVTLLCSAALAGTIANQIGGSTTDYSARFTDATGVNKGDEIRISGVRIGQVNDVKLVDRKIAQVDFSVREDVALPKSVKATIKFRNLIGQRYIALEQGTGPAERLAPDAIIPLEQTRPAVNLTQLFNGFRPLLQALSPNDVNQLSMELVQVLQGEGPTVSSLLARTATLTSTIADKDAVVGSVIDNLNVTLDTINARDTEFTQLVQTVRELVSGLSKDRNAIGDAVDSIDDLTDATADLLSYARPPLEKDIRHLGDLAENLNDNHKLVERFLVTLPKKLDVLIPLGTDTSRFNFFLCKASGNATIGPPISPVPISEELPLPPGIPIGGLFPRCNNPASLPNNFGLPGYDWEKHADDDDHGDN